MYCIYVYIVPGQRPERISTYCCVCKLYPLLSKDNATAPKLRNMIFLLDFHQITPIDYRYEYVMILSSRTLRYVALMRLRTQNLIKHMMKLCNVSWDLESSVLICGMLDLIMVLMTIHDKAATRRLPASGPIPGPRPRADVLTTETCSEGLRQSL